MDNFDMALLLIKEAQQEKRKYEEYRKDYKKILNTSSLKDWDAFFK